MKIATALAALVLLLGATSADAGWFGSKKLPKPVDTPIVRPKLDDSHKALKRQRHPPGYISSNELPGAPATA
jgi:hypothetical protein